LQIAKSMPDTLMREAGRRLAQALLRYKGRRDAVIVATTRESLPIAQGVADVLRVPFDIFLVRTITGGAVARGAWVPNTKALAAAGMSLIGFVEAARAEEQRIVELEASYRGASAAARLTSANILLVDDGASSPEDLLSAITALRRHGVGEIIVVTPL
jgi:predicted phosphoribosyltransferase